MCVSKCLHSVHHIKSKNIHVHLNIAGDDMSLKKYAYESPKCLICMMLVVTSHRAH